MTPSTPCGELEVAGAGSPAASLRRLAELPQQSDVRNRQGRLELSHRSINMNIDKRIFAAACGLLVSGGHGSAGG